MEKFLKDLRKQAQGYQLHAYGVVGGALLLLAAIAVANETIPADHPRWTVGGLSLGAAAALFLLVSLGEKAKRKEKTASEATKR